MTPDTLEILAEIHSLIKEIYEVKMESNMRGFNRD